MSDDSKRSIAEQIANGSVKEFLEVNGHDPRDQKITAHEKSYLAKCVENDKLKEIIKVMRDVLEAIANNHDTGESTDVARQALSKVSEIEGKG
jgi:arsenate reductase-like glutaredoxin family protein